MANTILGVVMRRSRSSLLIVFVISLALSGLQIQHTGEATRFSSSLPRISGSPLRMAPIVSSAPYDEQVGVTFTQNFPALTFNVTASDFTDNGIGPGYLVNGLTDRGYWYQVGLSFNWPKTDGTVDQGFFMNYEVFSPNLGSVDPATGGGGIQAFNGTVNVGDAVRLSLSYSAGSVLMQGIDWQTRSVASQLFPAYAYSKIFVGLTSSVAQTGFFSGLMTEQYHSRPFTGPGSPVAYSTSGSSLSSVWMWMDEWNTDNGLLLFDANTTSPVSLSEATGQYFSSNGTAEIATSHKLVTGLTPVNFPSLLAGYQSIGQPGHQASVLLGVNDYDQATVNLENITISTSFGKYNFTSESSFSFGPGLGQYSSSILIPTNLKLGIYNVTIIVKSWKYLDSQARTWIPLHSGSVNETLLITDSPPPPPNPPNSPGASPPSSSHGPTSTNRTSLSLSSVLTFLHSEVIPFLAGYVSVGVLAVVLLIRQERRRSTLASSFHRGFCANCGRELSPFLSVCPNCNNSADSAANANQSSLPSNLGQREDASQAPS